MCVEILARLRNPSEEMYHLLSKEQLIPKNVSREFGESSNQPHLNENMQSQEINQKQPHRLQKDNAVLFKNTNQLDKVKRILGEKKKQKHSWIRRLVSW